MKNNILYYFIKEEIRLHMSLTKSRNFYSYPLMLVIFFTGITVFSQYFLESFNATEVGKYLIGILFIGGAMSGTMGLYARDFLERKFGDIGKLFQNSLIQPIKLSKIFLTTALSDCFFYFFWFILPVILGYGIGLWILGQNSVNILFLIIAGLLSFITGLLISFILSVTYQRSIFYFIIDLIVLLITVFGLIYTFGITNISPFISFYLNETLTSFIISIITIIILAVISYFSVGREYKTRIKKNQIKKSFKFNKKINIYFMKDYIDMKRTGDLIAKPLFNVFIPSVLVLIMFTNSNNVAINQLGISFFAIILGTLGTQMLNSLINSDNLAYYRHLPTTLKDFIKPKIQLSLIICFIESIFVLLIYSYITKDLSGLFNALIITLSLLIYNFNLSFYLTGLNPNENLMNTKVFLEYFILLVPLLILIVIINILFNNAVIYLLGFLVLSILLGKLYLRLGLKKWDKIK